MITDTEARTPPDEKQSGFPVVGIGASAGGLEACRELLAALPPHTGMAFVLVQHLEPHHDSHLAEILARSTKMTVLQVQNNVRIEPEHVYVVPPNMRLTVKGSTLQLAPRGESPTQYYPIDHFFFSLAEELGTAAIGIILSGSASDGAQGLKAIKCAAGTTFCQDEASARYGGMPHSAIATGAVDFVLPPSAIAAEVVRIGMHPYLGNHGTGDGNGFESGKEDIRKILSLLRNNRKVDFTQYKQNTIRRRIARRMLVHNLSTPQEYVSFLEGNPAELEDLYRDILISVTQFFREPEMFESLARLVSEMVTKRDRELPFRIWSAGCATGEEAYSLAITISEVLEAAGLSTPVQLFGTDISEIAIDRARAAVYPETIQQYVSPERLSKSFTRVEAGYRISKSIRESCIFARHDIIRDPPFSQLDIVSCRNVLIYLGTAAQQRVIQALHYSLRPDGLLVLGSAESVGSRPDLFATVDNENKIFSRKRTPNRLIMTLPDPQGFEKPDTDRKLIENATVHTLVNVEVRATRILRDLYAPAGVTIDESMQIVHFHGPTSLYLEPPSGEASLNLFRVAHQNLLFALRKAIDTAADRADTVTESGVRFERDGEVRELTIRVIPIPEGSAHYYLVLFEDTRSRASSLPTALPGSSESGVLEFQLAQARRELDDSRDYLRKIIEQHEVAIEELRAANEEVQSSNEEMQSANEELRTAKEELQSSNEELITVNEELKNLNAELSSANNDLSNVLNAVTIPIVMVGMDYRIRRYTPAAERLLSTVPADLGRMITEIGYAVQVPGLKVMLADAIETLGVQQKKVQNRDGRWFSVMVRPYRTMDDRID
ncbi:MAG: two-component system, chemotaxis family, CheB/CheR fusion protein, partial [Bryobacterales bacterium]|nr:two-component system, chemotaxis family, CheB/CheR fusion protein [Bryobacterales bacterium]